MKLTAEHRQTKNKHKRNDAEEKDTQGFGAEDITVHTRDEGPTVQLCGDSNVTCKWNNGEFVQGTKYEDTIGKIQRILHSWWKKGVAKPISNIDSFVNHVYREHNQEAYHWASMGAQGRRKIVIDCRGESTIWKAIRGFCDGSFKDIGRSGVE